MLNNQYRSTPDGPAVDWIDPRMSAATDCEVADAMRSCTIHVCKSKKAFSAYIPVLKLSATR